MITVRPSRLRLALASAALLALVAATWAAPAGAASTASCAKAVVADWYDNGRVDKVYERHCYRDAIKILPVDVREYSGAEDDILRALLYARQGQPDPGDEGTDGGGPGAKPKPDPTPDPSPGPTPDPGPGQSPVDTSGPSAVPVPLIVLAGIAGLLLVLGAAGYVTRRLATRRGDGGPPA